MPSFLPEFNLEKHPEPFFVKYFGYELEGLYDSDFGEYGEDEDGNSERYNEYFKEDGSVSISGNGIEGEIASPKFRVDRMEQFENFVNDNMPMDVNASCGLHCHLSFNNLLAYEKCMDSEYWIEFRKQVYEFVNPENFSEYTVDLFHDRYNNASTYCRDVHSPDGQVNSLWTDLVNNPHGRYTQLNYPFTSHGTIECRLFAPTSQPKEVIKIVNWFIDFTNSYLKKQTRERANFETHIMKNQKERMYNEVFSCV
jgi:hypothetical protein